MLRRVLIASAATVAFAMSAGTAGAADPTLVGKWSFDSATAGDSSGNWSTFALKGSAAVSDGKLTVDGTGNGGYAATAWAQARGYSGPAITDKTLISWVALDSTAITSGSPMGLTKQSGDAFDSIVYAEQQSFRWMAGSDYFRRTSTFSPNVDDTAISSLRQIAISYQANVDGTQTITGCLNGDLLGSYRTGKIGFAKEENLAALFGPRHMSGGANGAPVGSIRAKIDESRMYSRAISCAAVADTDFDYALAEGDNCSTVANVDQKDLDADGMGDECDSDLDGDGVANADDPAPSNADRDGDGVKDGADAFPDDINEQKDTDGDGTGDNADAFDDDNTETTDSDGDGVGDNRDNCDNDANVDQKNTDEASGDTEGDVCDSDIDGDGYSNEDDALDYDATDHQDSDGDGTGDKTDKYPFVNREDDSDDDGTVNALDNCPTTPNENQADKDGDKIGDACDSDRDGDGIPNGSDNAPDDANADQADLDRDGLADVLDSEVLPLSADACKKNGWTRYYDGSARFKNQGDCVSYVATGDRNLMAG